MYNQHNKRKKTKLKKCSKPNNKTSSIQKTLVMGSKSKKKSLGTENTNIVEEILC